MKPKLLKEAFVVSRALTDNGKNMAYIDPSKPENKDSFKYKDIFKKWGASWYNTKKVWAWWLGEDKTQWQRIYDTKIKPCLEEVHKLEGAPQEASSGALVASLDAIINDIKVGTVSTQSNDSATEQEKTNTLSRLEKFKQKIVNLGSDEEFKNTMKAIMEFKNSQGHTLSPNNALLVWLQNPHATMVKSKTNWGYLNRQIKENAQRLLIWAPSSRAIIRYRPEQRAYITQEFLKARGKGNTNELTPGDQEKLRLKLNGSFSGGSFDLVINYDIADTVVMEGKEDKVNYEDYKKIKWYDDTLIDERVKPIYNALIGFATENGIDVTTTADLGGARGVSKSGSIEVLNNEGNDVDMTKTLAHELSHEILHQKYLKDKNPAFANYFVGKDEGRSLVEQQAELSAWMILAEYGFDLKTSFNYVAMWGADKDNMIKVFDTISKTVNMMLEYIDSHVAKNRTTEPAAELTEIAPAQSGHHVTPFDVAKILGVEDEFKEVVRTHQKREQFNESFNRLSKYKLKEK